MKPRARRPLDAFGRHAVVLVALVALAGCDPWRSTPTWDESADSPGSFDVSARRFGPIPSCPKADDDKLWVGVKWDIPQFGLADRHKGTWEGLDVDMAWGVTKELSRQLSRGHDLKLVLVGTKTEDRERYLVDDCVDIVFSTFTATPDRCENPMRKVDCSHPYFVAHQRFLTLKDAATLTATNVARTGKRVCTTEGSTLVDIMNDDLKIRPENQRKDGVFSTCVERLKREGSDQVDAVLGDDANLLGYLLEDPDQLKFSGPPLPGTNAEYVAAVKKDRLLGDTRLVGRVNEALKTMQPTPAELCHKWVGFLRKEACNPNTPGKAGS